MGYGGCPRGGGGGHSRRRAPRQRAVENRSRARSRARNRASPPAAASRARARPVMRLLNHASGKRSTVCQTRGKRLSSTAVCSTARLGRARNRRPVKRVLNRASGKRSTARLGGAATVNVRTREAKGVLAVCLYHEAAASRARARPCVLGGAAPRARRSLLVSHRDRPGGRERGARVTDRPGAGARRPRSRSDLSEARNQAAPPKSSGAGSPARPRKRPNGRALAPLAAAGG